MGHAIYINIIMEEVRKTKEIDIVGIIKDVLKNPKTLVVFSATFFVLGIITAFNSQRHTRAT